MKFIDPRIDYAFRKIFGSEDAKEILISFLESLMGLEGEKRIRDIVITDPYLLPTVKALKTSILDVRCTDHRGISYIVEMQVRKVRAFLRRIQYNASKTYAGQIATSDDYPKLNQVIAVTITDFSLFDSFAHYVSRHITQEEKSGEHYLTGIIYYFIELPKFEKELNEIESVLDKWIYFIKKARELEEIPEKFRSGPFDRAFQKAMIANMNPRELEDYDKACMAVADARGAIELAMEEGRKEGESIGMEKGEKIGMEKGGKAEREKIAKNMLQSGMDTAQICQLTGLSKEEIENLRI